MLQRPTSVSLCSSVYSTPGSSRILEMLSARACSLPAVLQAGCRAQYTHLPRCLVVAGAARLTASVAACSPRLTVCNSHPAPSAARDFTASSTSPPQRNTVRVDMQPYRKAHSFSGHVIKSLDSCAAFKLANLVHLAAFLPAACASWR